jgi:hypothetical protein
LPKADANAIAPRIAATAYQQKQDAITVAGVSVAGVSSVCASFDIPLNPYTIEVDPNDA